MPPGPPLTDLLFAQSALPVVVLCGQTGAVQRANSAFAELSNRHPEELPGRDFLQLVPPAERDAVRAGLTATPAPALPLLHHLLVREGAPRPVRTGVARIDGPDGPLLLLIAPQPDAPTLAVAPEGVLPGQGHLFRQIVLNAHEGVWTLDAQLRTTFVNPRMCEMLGYTAAELRARPVSDFLFPEEIAAQTEELGRRRQGLSTRYERRFRRKDGTEVWALVSGTPLTGPRGEFRGSFGMFTDITERKRADHALQLSEERYRSLLAAATDYVFTVHYTNGHPSATTHGPGCVKITGYLPHDYAADPYLWYQMIEPDDRAAVESHIARATAGDKADTIEHRLHHRNGSTRWVRSTLVPSRDPTGLLLAVDGLVTDITERRQLETQLLHAQRLEVVGRLAGGIAHDLNNILQPVLMAPGLLRPAIQDPETLQLVDTIETSVRRGAEIIQQLLAFSRGTEARRVPLQLDSVVTEVTRQLSGALPRNIALSCSLPACTRPILGDALQLQQALMNLCVNARDAMRETGGTLTLGIESITLTAPLPGSITASRAGCYQVLSVADTGTGIAPEFLPKLFDPFFTTKDVGEGTGLGLPTVLGIVRTHDGFLDVSSTHGQGSVFRVFLPEANQSPPSTGPCR